MQQWNEMDSTVAYVFRLETKKIFWQQTYNP